MGDIELWAVMVGDYDGSYIAGLYTSEDLAERVRRFLEADDDAVVPYSYYIQGPITINDPASEAQPREPG